ncbi:porin family protein [Idiomarina aminovorans]|uniref:porin family protein n=1 Tax=Idiomarina aminovorans TaxID=2914829 RepID=UPI00200564FA|nr:porin family protein [Idiomarina sp. ATCH4]MCK7460518.1 porin family protein [Idiomarina sp. ATCH4]
MRKTVIALAMLTLPSAALAESPNWNKVDASYLDTDVGVEGLGDLSFDGFRVGGSAAINPELVVLDNLFIFADFDSISNDDSNADLDVDFLSAGIGSYKHLTETTDLYATVSFERVESEISIPGLSTSDSDKTWGVGIGLRSMLTPKVEVDAKLDYVAFDEEVVRVNLSAFYHVTKNVSLGLGYETRRETQNLDVDSLSATVRYSF